MTGSNIKIKEAKQLIKTELKNQYPDNEINSLINVIFKYLLNYSQHFPHVFLM